MKLPINTKIPSCLQRFFATVSLLIILTNNIVAQCSSCTYTATGSTYYTVNTGETLCITGTGLFTGSVRMEGGTIINCSTVPQTFGIDPGNGGTFENHGTYVAGTGLIWSNAFTVQNHGTIDMNGFVFFWEGTNTFYNHGVFKSTNGTYYFNDDFVNNGMIDVNNGTINMGASATLTNAGYIFLDGTLSVCGSCTLTTSDGCIEAGNFENSGTLNSTGSCSDIKVAANTINSGTITGPLSIIDESPPGAAPFIDSNTGTITGVTWSSCADCIPEEICGNNHDDNRDGRVDEPFPGGVQNDLVFWVKADEGTNTTLDGANVDAWADQSMSDFDAAANAGATDFPLYNENGINYNPTIDFDGSYTDDLSDGLHLGSNYIYGDKDGMQIFSVVQNNSNSGSYGFVYDFGSFSGNGYGFNFNGSSLSVYAVGANNTFSFNSHPTRPSLFQQKIDFDSNIFLYKNGSTVFSPSLSTTELTAANINENNVYTGPGANQLNGPFSIGRKSSNYSLELLDAVFDGKIAEIILFDSILTINQTHRIESYLAVKYGMTLAHNYYDSDGTLLRGTVDYENNIFGIGRDDCSGLNQKQSSSVNESGLWEIGLGVLASNNASNTNTFTSDKSYMLLGHDNGTINAWTTTEIENGFEHQIANRMWKVTTQNFNENLTIRINVDHVDPIQDIPEPHPTSNDYYVSVYTSPGVFSYHIPLTQVGSSSIYEATNVNVTASVSYVKISTRNTCAAQAPTLSK